ncbi:MAG: hypothetical protein JWO95_881 [Verrucomicrobiales bacterium]|nr:hypothetical protein [Verrucomicrobiales bacterium]
MLKKLTYVAGIVSVAGVLSACSTTRSGYASNDRYANDPCGDKNHQNTYSSFNSMENEASGAQANIDTSAQSQAGGDQLAIPLYEERVNVGKQAIPSQVQIRKFTTTETVSVPVELRHEHVVVERVPAGQGGSQAQAGAAFQDKAFTIQVQEEQPLVQKQTVQTGQVIARKDSQSQRINVQQQVRREDVQVDRNGNNANVELRGNFNEAAGAQSPQQQQQWQGQQQQQPQQQQQSQDQQQQDQDQQR